MPYESAGPLVLFCHVLNVQFGSQIVIAASVSALAKLLIGTLQPDRHTWFKSLTAPHSGQVYPTVISSIELFTPVTRNLAHAGYVMSQISKDAVPQSVKP